MARIQALLGRLAISDLPVLITGETGVGKEHAARTLHVRSRRASHRLIAVNCAALPDALVESELFGHERGAFTGAVATRPGLVEQADGGVLFLDEVGELALAAQAKLLRALELQRVCRLGGATEISVDVRLVAATNRDLAAEVRAGRFRQDLLFRINAATVHVPPLRARPAEILSFARHFLERVRGDLTLSPSALDRLAHHRWPGNIRELKNVIEYAAATVEGSIVHACDLALDDDECAPPPAPVLAFRPISEELRELERRRMVEALVAARGVQKHAATLIAMPLRTFAMKVKQYGLARSLVQG